MVGTYGQIREGIVLSVDDDDSSPFVLFGGAIVFDTTNYDNLQIDFQTVSGGKGTTTGVVTVSGASKLT